MNYDDPITCLKGIGEKTAALYEKLGIVTIGELMRYYPRSYERFEPPVTIRAAAVMDFAAVRVVICSYPTIKRVRNLSIINTKVRDEEGSELRVTWFQTTYLASVLRPGGWYVLRGKLSGNGKSRTLDQPQVYALDAYEQLQKSLQPVYALTAKITSKSISKAVAAAYDAGVKQKATIPEKVLSQYNLLPEDEAGYLMHFPKDEVQLTHARKTIAFGEFYHFLLGVNQMKKRLLQEKNHFALTRREEVTNLIKQLPYDLTGAQLRTIEEITQDMTGDHMMSRLLQGDVGSGKTIVAFLSMYQAALCHYQSALMAPTEVLASQHYQGFTELSERYHLNLSIVLLTGSMRAGQKKEALRQIREHEADIVIGTHAVIQEKVEFDDLALVITDEQHRFGVAQRDALSKKGHTPHVLVMSATPIPRTLAIVLYGDLEVSVLDEMPKNRLPIKNCVVDPSFRKKAYAFLEAQVEAGHQVYVICPMVEAGEDSADGLENVTDYTEKLKAALNSSIRVAALHGKMKAAQKQEIMDAFGAGQIDILVSTTVIEVGINVPNATVMLVENAERFGLAQLHQLRGRVGRGHAQSFCIFMTGDGSGAKNKRLDVLNHSNDGFFIANEDLKLRGPGDLFGIRQSGDLDFGLGDIYQDSDVLMLAGELADQVLSGDVVLPEKEFGLFEKSIDYRTI